MEARHDHPDDACCRPICPGWGEGALQLFALQRRYSEMLDACRRAAAIEWLEVSPFPQGTILPCAPPGAPPGYQLRGKDVVRLNLYVRGAEVLLDEWGVRCNLRWWRSRRVECALPWPAILRGSLWWPWYRCRSCGLEESWDYEFPEAYRCARCGAETRSVPAPDFWREPRTEKTDDGATCLRASGRWAKMARVRVGGGRDPHSPKRIRSSARWMLAKGFRGEVEPRWIAYGRTEDWAMEQAEDWLRDESRIGRDDDLLVAALREWSKECS